MEVAILGGGAWGSTLADLAQRQGHRVRIWSRSGGIELEDVLRGAEITIVALSMAGVRDVAPLLQPNAVSGILVSGTKGLDPSNGDTPSQIWQQNLPRLPIVVLSGPNLSLEIRQGLPAASVVASKDIEAARVVQGALASRNFRLYTNNDPLGVELGGTLKNVIAIAVGVCDGLCLGTNAKAALITRSLQEIIRIGTDYGAKPETFWGLSGLGDLLATCSSNLSRNYRVGLGLASGKNVTEILANLEGTAEGVFTAGVIAQKHHLYTPICAVVHRLIKGELQPQEALTELLARDLRSEFDLN